MHLRGGVCLVVGSTRMVSAIGDFSVGNPISGSEHNGVGEHDLHVLDCTSVFGRSSLTREESNESCYLVNQIKEADSTKEQCKSDLSYEITNPSV